MQEPALKEGGLKESSNCTKAQYEINKGYIDIWIMQSYPGRILE